MEDKAQSKNVIKKTKIINIIVEKKWKLKIKHNNFSNKIKFYIFIYLFSQFFFIFIIFLSLFSDYF
jgi:hypothetical protein